MLEPVNVPEAILAESGTWPSYGVLGECEEASEPSVDPLPRLLALGDLNRGSLPR